MKKLISLLLVLAMALTLVACGGKTEAPAETQAAAPEAAPEAPAADVTTYDVGVAIYQFNDNFMTSYRQELETYMKSLETDTVKYNLTMVDGKNDMAEQTNQIDTFITQGMDVIILNLVQTSSAEVLIDKVVGAGIPLILINREPLAYGEDGKPLNEAYEGILNNENVCYIGCDARQSGTFQGEIILGLENKGDINGDGVVKYIMVEGDPENIDAQYRTEFSVKALTDAGVAVECLADQIGNWDQTKGQEITAAALAQFGADIEVVFCNNDAMAFGAAAALEAAGRVVGEDVYLVGVDALPEAIEMVNAGTMTGTVQNDHVAQSHTAADVAVKVLNGEAMENYYWCDYALVTAG